MNLVLRIDLKTVGVTELMRVFNQICGALWAGGLLGGKKSNAE